MIDAGRIRAALWDRTTSITTAEVAALAQLRPHHGVGADCRRIAKEHGRSDLDLRSGLRLSQVGGGAVVDDPCTHWARWTWHFTEPGWDAAEAILDDALVVLLIADLLPDDVVAARIGPVIQVLGLDA